MLDEHGETLAEFLRHVKSMPRSNANSFILLGKSGV
jgi:hypothetical protein